MYALCAVLMQLTVGYSSMQQLSCDSYQAFKQGSRNSRTTQYPPTSPYKSHIGVPHHTFPTVDLVECTSHITSLLQHRCLTSWGKLPQYKTFPLASTLHTNPSLSLVLSLGLSHTNTHRQREIKTTPPTPTFSTATTWWYALKPWVNRIYAGSTHAAPCDNPEGSKRVPLLHTALSIGLPPNWLHLAGSIFFHNSGHRHSKEYFLHFFIWSSFGPSHSKASVLSWWLDTEELEIHFGVLTLTFLKVILNSDKLCTLSGKWQKDTKEVAFKNCLKMIHLKVPQMTGVNLVFVWIWKKTLN